MGAGLPATGSPTTAKRFVTSLFVDDQDKALAFYCQPRK